MVDLARVELATHPCKGRSFPLAYKPIFSKVVELSIILVPKGSRTKKSLLFSTLYFHVYLFLRLTHCVAL